MKRVVIYVRVSTQEQATEGYSVQEQIVRLRKYCEAHGWVLVEEYVDPGFSGATINRPALQKLLHDIPSGNFDTVLVYKLDRLSRSQKDTMQLIEDEFLANSIDFISMKENFDTGTPFGIAMIGILSVFSQLERSQIKERMGMGKEARAKEGKWGGGSTVPVGYYYSIADNMLYVDEYEAMQVRELFDLFLKGKAFKTIADTLNKKGYSFSGRSGHDGRWDAKRVKYVLTNKLYIGYIRHHDQWFKGTHEPIIDEETFNKAQILFQQRVKENAKYIKKRNGQTSYLGGLLYCKHCGGRYAKQSGRRWKDNEPPLYYNCYSRSKKVPRMVKDPNCQNKHWRMPELDEIIFNEIKKLALDPEYIKNIQEAETAKNGSENTIVLLKKEIQKLDNQISRFLDLYGTGMFTIEQVSSKVEPLNDQKQALERELNSLSEEEGILSNEETIKIAQSFGAILENGDFEEIRLVIETLIRFIELDNDDVYIHWNFA